MNCRQFTIIVLLLLFCSSCNPLQDLKNLFLGRKSSTASVQKFSENIQENSCESSLVDCLNDQIDPPNSADCHDIIVDNISENARVDIPNPNGNGWKKIYSTWALEGSDQIVQNENLSDEDLNKLGCPGYKSASKEERKLFWPYLLAALAKKESNYRPTTDYPECSNGTRWDPNTLTAKQAATHQGASSCWISSGLFQLTRSTVENSPYSCHFKTSGWKAVHDPEDNIKCALRVLNQQIKSCGLFCKTSKAYFGPLKRDKDSLEIQEHFKSIALTHLPFCRAGGTNKLGEVAMDSKCSRISNEAGLKSDQSPEVRSPSSSTINQ